MAQQNSRVMEGYESYLDNFATQAREGREERKRLSVKYDNTVRERPFALDRANEKAQLSNPNDKVRSAGF